MSTALTTGLFALSGAIIGQILNNRYTVKREENKEIKQVYQELHSATLNDLYAIVDITLNFRKIHDLKIDAHEDTYWDDLLAVVEKNLKYASPKVVSAYQDFMKYRYTLDFVGSEETRSKLNIAICLLDDIYDAVISVKIMDENQIKKINYYRTIYLTWMYLLKNINDIHLVENAMRYYWIYDEDLLTEEFYESTKRRFEIAIDPDYFHNVFRDVMYNIVNNNSKDIFEESVMSVFQQDGIESIDYPLNMTKKERDKFLKNIYFSAIYMGGQKFELIFDENNYDGFPKNMIQFNRLFIVEEYELDFYTTVAKYWEEKEYISTKKYKGHMELKINAKGIDYIETEYS